MSEGRGRAATPLERPRAVLLYFACQAAFALVFAVGATALVAGTGVTHFAHGDRTLFEPGGLLLTETLGRVLPLVPGHAASGLALGTLALVLLLVPHGALVAALARPAGEGTSRLFGYAVEKLSTLLSLTGTALLLQVLLLAASGLLAAAVRNAAFGSARASDGAGLLVVAAGVALVVAVGVLRDLARAAAIDGDLAARGAAGLGIAVLLRLPRRVLFAWAPPAARGVVLVGLGAWLVGAIDVSRDGGWRVVSVFLVHQLIALGLLALRALWLGRSVTLVREEARYAAPDSLARR